MKPSYNAMGSVLVNGSPTLEFQFHKGLKQGDPISPFLFILIMETLHLTFKRVLNAGLYKGISLNDSFTISHLFYADDVVFIGEWNNNNIETLLGVLRCFYLASGLKINLHKSKLMGIGVSSNVVAAAASLIGCSILTAPFNYLGVKVGNNMSRINSWDDVISKVSSRLSKWKLKLLSIGVREVALKVLYKRLYALEMCKSISVAEKMGHPSMSHSFRRMPRGGVKQENYGLLCLKVADLLKFQLDGLESFPSRYFLRDVVINLALQNSIALWEFSTKACSLIR
ncbi:RNA-directed DNA polymerase, eukaryota [Tanacetum coccineum]